MAVVLWLAIALAAGIIEAVTITLVSVWFALGAVCAAVCAGFGADVTVQYTVFAIVSLVLLALTAPLCRKFRLLKTEPTNADRLIGKIGIVTEDIDPILGKGEVKVGGQSWSACAKGEDYLSTGAKVVVEEIVGAHLVVSAKYEEEDL